MWNKKLLLILKGSNPIVNRNKGSRLFVSNGFWVWNIALEELKMPSLLKEWPHFRAVNSKKIFQCAFSCKNDTRWWNSGQKIINLERVRILRVERNGKKLFNNLCYQFFNFFVERVRGFSLGRVENAITNKGMCLLSGRVFL